MFRHKKVYILRGSFGKTKQHQVSVTSGESCGELEIYFSTVYSLSSFEVSEFPLIQYLTAVIGSFFRRLVLASMSRGGLIVEII
ncbi:hypothetical protein WN51_14175 [Melipona quadrifasciata]|uniref:Uncharacterized protein n=1 Tax=Melipona quadrifasciata TaxID=166423 RepID=A0A0M8ZZ62_9HYME|nr:hypothetical protein WN51_14175 [Melipona quadrifasciata]